MYKIIYWVVVLLLVSGCNKPEKQQVEIGCTVEFGCPIIELGNIVALTLPQQIVPEHLFEISLEFSSPITNLQAHLEGVSMYMGKIPIMFESSNSQLFKAQTILGSCSDNHMQWRVIISWQHNNQTVTAYRLFTITR